MNGSSTICPCDTFTHPQVISNTPEQKVIAYRIGDFISFREALLRSRTGEVELANWRPGAQGDLAVQMIEWWAYLADILTFYNERIANQSYLLTADLPESVRGIIRILGYRPRPGIGATGTLAALMTGIKPFTLPEGFQIQSKPGPGKQPQIFELGADTLVQQPDILNADPQASPLLLSSGVESVLLQGTISSIKPMTNLLLLENGWTAQDTNYALATVASTALQKDPRGKANTLVTFQAPVNQLSGKNASDYSLLRSSQSAHLWQYAALNFVFSIDTTTGKGTAHLDSVVRQIHVGDPILFDGLGGSPSVQLVSVTSYTEMVYYANPTGSPADPSVQPPSPPNIPIPILHSVIGFQTTTPVGNWTVTPQMVMIRYMWQSVGALISTPSTTLTSTAVSLLTPLPGSLLPMVDQNVLISDKNGNGVEVQATADTSDPSTPGLSNFSDPSVSLAAPLSVLFDLLSVSRGKTVANEILGSGDATITTGQEFVLQKSPLTYLQSGSSASGADYKSTLQVWVNGVEWYEVPSFYGQPEDAHIFVTREDDQNVTHVQFGDGVNGARLPSGANNVVAKYRYGSGADAPDTGSLSVILQSWPGLKAILNPAPVGGGADPDPPQQIKTYAPQSVLTFGRAISADDYEAIAAQAPGVARARSYWTWDSSQQRMMVKVYVGDNANAVNSANQALASASDPNRPLKVILATALPITLALTLVVDPSYVAADVVTAATAALIDPDGGLLGVNAIGIGQSIWQSQVYKACLGVPGVLAVHDLEFLRKLIPLSFFISHFAFAAAIERASLLKIGAIFRPATTAASCQDFFADPGEGNFFQLAAADLHISPEVAIHGG